MPSTKQACDGLVRRVGYDPGRTKEVARALTEAQILPAGSPGVSPDLSPQDVATLMLGVAVDAPLRAVAETVREYRSLRREGVPQGAPASISSTAGEALDILAEIAASGTPDAKALVAKTIIAVVSNWQEIALTDTIDVRRFSAGEPGRWQAYGHRKSVEINGGAFATVIAELFAGDRYANL
ncbi:MULTISPECIES: hypothetical protein [unclassified Mesorhizobium]|uniref:hypothetical protein n=1 Tax=unclassified Mesorhizobium TaxID=325217 RepID=UPI000FCC42DF|nr:MULTISPECIES: hypothetical protein [unclassified Mesorhizobium]RUW71022.1 hypothetical protein EOA31_18890 [Mesorhizobium sp. M4B.F.Ca.ET.049.02.1.2]TGV26438.1 hypothetical protein EN786_13065 [Mesorhizobium sp. M4B.F.Ca.ET.143.01.1.1]TIW27099.1 MAG: hypothetical protein E5V63_10935 [Mesorhizobium sp.]